MKIPHSGGFNGVNQPPSQDHWELQCNAQADKDKESLVRDEHSRVVEVNKDAIEAPHSDTDGGKN